MTAGGSQLSGCRALRLPALSIYSSVSNSELWGRCGGGGDLRDFKNLRNSLLFRTPRIWACASLVGDPTTITRGGHTTPTHPNPRNALVSGLWPAGGGCLGRLPAAGSPHPPGIRHRALQLVVPGTCLAIRGRGVRFLCDLTFDLNRGHGSEESHKGHKL